MSHRRQKQVIIKRYPNNSVYQHNTFMYEKRGIWWLISQSISVKLISAQLQFTAWSKEDSSVSCGVCCHCWNLCVVTFSIMSWVGFPMCSSGSVLYSRASGTVGLYRRQCFSPSNWRINTYTGGKKALRTHSHAVTHTNDMKCTGFFIFKYCQRS